MDMQKVLQLKGPLLILRLLEPVFYGRLSGLITRIAAKAGSSRSFSCSPPFAPKPSKSERAAFILALHWFFLGFYLVYQRLLTCCCAKLFCVQGKFGLLITSCARSSAGTEIQQSDACMKETLPQDLYILKSLHVPSKLLRLLSM